MSRISKNQLASMLQELLEELPKALNKPFLNNSFLNNSFLNNSQTPLNLWQIESINTGLNNQLWLLSEPNSMQKLVCRITQANNALTKNSQNGIRLQQQLSDTGISAKVHYHSQMNDISITLMDYIEGTTDSANHWSEQQRKTFAEQLASLHQSATELPLERLDITTHLNGYIQKLKGKLDRQKLVAYQQAIKEISQQIEQTNESFSAIAPQITPVIAQQGICHNDLNQLNIVYSRTEQQFVLIDWDEARIGDCFFDLASFTIEHKLNQAQTHQWLKYYVSERNQNPNRPIDFAQIIDKLNVYQRAYRLTCELWHHLYQSNINY